ncbi:MAG: phosphopantetheine-binding protein, partial [Rhodospirillales bacterium]
MSMGERPSGIENAGREPETAARLLAQVRAVATELRPHLADAPVTLDSLLDKDLGFDSLGRVEVLVRLERVFGVSLPETVFADAETPRDLLRAILGASGAPAAAAAIDGGALGDAALGETAVPFAAETLTEVLDWHVRAHADRPHIRLYDDEGEGEAITFRELAAGAQRVAAGLQRGGFEPGRAVVI